MANVRTEVGQVTEKGKIYDIYDRAFSFAVDIASFLKRIKSDYDIKIYAQQLIRSSSSIGANLAEADGALTKKDFINKVGIARRESNESGHWLKLIRDVSIHGNHILFSDVNMLIQESRELTLILSSIILKSKGI